jgi:hypothetical protein
MNKTQYILDLCESLKRKIELTKWIYLREQMNLYFFVGLLALMNIVAIAVASNLDFGFGLSLVLALDVYFLIVSFVLILFNWQIARRGLNEPDS